MPDRDPPIPAVPDSRAVPKKKTRLSPVWFIPIVAALVGVWVAVARIRSEGPDITIVFQSAEGLEAGKAKINYRGVDVGTITAIRLSEDHQRVVATEQMTPRTEDFLVADTRLWVVRPRISGANVTGLGTLISGAYIGIEIGSSKEPKRDFVALETPPVVTGNAPGRFFVLKTSDLGSLDTGTPLFFRRLQVSPVSIPSAVDRPEFVVQTAPNRVDIDEFNRWAAPLNDSIAQAVAGDLVKLLGTLNVAAAPMANFAPAYRVTIDVQRFESVQGQLVPLDAVWTVHRTAGGATRSGCTTAPEAAQGDGFDALAAAHSRAVAKLSADIATAIRAQAEDQQ